MTLSMHQATAPVFACALRNMSAILAKAEASAEARKIEPAVFLQSRLAPDMFPLVRQVQIASDGVKGCMARLAGVDVPGYPDTETTFEEVQARIAKTLAFIESFTPEQIDGTEDKVIVLKIGGRDMEFKGLDYVFGFVTPNLYFHATTAYAILRHNGVELGKRDFLGA